MTRFLGKKWFRKSLNTQGDAKIHTCRPFQLNRTLKQLQHFSWGKLSSWERAMAAGQQSTSALWQGEWKVLGLPQKEKGSKRGGSGPSWGIPVTLPGPVCLCHAFREDQPLQPSLRNAACKNGYCKRREQWKQWLLTVCWASLHTELPQAPARQKPA